MKKMTLLFAALLTVMSSANAKTFTTTLWEDTYTGAIELNAETVATFKAGDVLRIYATIPEGGANFKLVYKGASNGWTETTIPSVGDTWPWISGGNTYYDVTFTDDDITALSGMNIYIEKGENSTVTKVEHRGEVTPSGETELLTENWTASWTAKTFAAQSEAKIGDVIRFSYSAPGGWSYYQFNILDAYGNADSFTNTATNVATSIETAANLYFDFEITNGSDLEKIQNEGFGIKGDNFTLTSVKLLTFTDSYDAVAITIGEEGFATYSNGNKNVQVSACDAVAAYYASAVATGTVTLTALTCIPASQGVVLKGEPGTYTIPVGADGWTDISASNHLKATGNYSQNVAASTAGTCHYILAKRTADSKTGFYKLTADHTLGANKAYLETDTDITPTNAPVALLFDADVTGIDATLMKSEQRIENSIYDLQGRQIVNGKSVNGKSVNGKSVNGKLQKGLYIVNGRKVVIK